jgi:hypothetical protein
MVKASRASTTRTDAEPGAEADLRGIADVASRAAAVQGSPASACNGPRSADRAE